MKGLQLILLLFNYGFEITLKESFLLISVFSGRACKGMVSKAMCGEVPL